MDKKRYNTPIKDYLGYEDLFYKLGYRTHTPTFGSLGKALLAASKRYGRSTLSKQLGVYFKKLREHKKEKFKKNDNLQKQDSRHNL